jgi:lipopolysaccharide transport system permease protein
MPPNALEWSVTAPTASRKPTLVIRPRVAWLPANPRELWEFRELLVRFAARDVTLRYRQTALGVIWVILVPLLGAGILSFVFGGVADLPAPDGLPYFVFSLAGMVAWTAFSQVANRSAGSLLANAGLVQKVFFPRLLLPFSTVLSTLVDVGVSLVLLGVLLAGYGLRPGWEIVTFPLWFLLVIAFGLGIGLTASALMVRYRDVQYILPVGIQFLLFASPVAYTLASVPDDARRVFELNPLTGLLEGMRWALIDTARPTPFLMAYASVSAVAALAAGLMVFSRMERQFADVI